MVKSGVKVSQELLDEVAKFEKAASNPYDYMLFKLSEDGSEVVLDLAVPKGTSEEQYASVDMKYGMKRNLYGFFEALKHAKLPNGKPACRYGVCYVEYHTDDRGTSSQPAFFYYGNSQASIKDKMVYSSSQHAVKEKIKSIQFQVEVNDEDDLDFKEIVHKVSRGKCSFS